MATNRWTKALIRAAVPRAGLGNLIVGGSGGGAGKGPKVATQNVSWNSPGQPQILDQDAQAFGEDAYLNQVYVMRGVQTIANTIAGLEFRAGMDPMVPQNHDPMAPLAQLLGPATPQAPGGPNPETSSRAFWAWSICQYIVYGRFAWECQLDQKQIVALWPLVSACISAIPTQGGGRFFDSYVYTTPMAGDIPMKRDQMIYGWRPSITDWRVPETVLSSAKLPIYIAKGLDRYMVKLLQNDMVASTLVVTPVFEEPSARRAWQEQFNTSFSGVDNRGKTIFAEADYDEDDTSGKPLIQIEKIAQTAIEASLLEISNSAKEEICVALGVPLSLIGNASQRIYANADSEYKNYWTLTVVNLITELQDHINNLLAPRVGQEVGWFDLSRVAALQPPSIFQAPMIGDVIQTGVATAAQVANVLNIPAVTATDDADSDTIELGEESSSTGAGDSGGARSWRGTRVNKQQLINAYLRYEQRPLNTYNLGEEFSPSKYLEREHITVRSTTVEPAQRLHPEVRVKNVEAKQLEQTVWAVRERTKQRALENRKARTAELVRHTVQTAMDIRSVAVADRTTDKVHTSLSAVYPESTLGWVDDADWTGPKMIPLASIDMHQRPGGRDPKKVAGIAKGIAAGVAGCLAPVVLVKTPGSDKLKIADGYHRTKANEKLGRDSVNAYVGTVEDENGPWDTEMHDKKLNRAMELELRHETMPGKFWHNSEGGSPHATKAQLIEHMVNVHGADVDPETTATKGFLDLWHASDHSAHGECGAHEPDSRNAWLPNQQLATEPCAYCGKDSVIQHASTSGTPIPTCAEHASKGHEDANGVRTDAALEEVPPPKAVVPELMPFNGMDLDDWVEANSDALLALVTDA